MYQTCGSRTKQVHLYTYQCQYNEVPVLYLQIRNHCFRSSKNVTFIEAEQKDRIHYKLDRVTEDIQAAQAK